MKLGVNILAFFLIVSVVSGVCESRRITLSDVCIVGGGTAGSVIAKELSEDEKLSVTLLEYGGDASEIYDNSVYLYGGPIYGNPANAKYLLSKNAYADYLTTQETNLGLKSFEEPIAKLLGGSQTINGNAFNRISAEDLASWGSDYWLYDATLQDWKKLETALDSDPLYHGTDGPLITDRFTMDESLSIMNRTMVDVLGGIYNPDLSSNVTTGVGLMYRNIGLENGLPMRQTTFNKILRPVMDRENLNVISSANVYKIRLGIFGKYHRVKYYHEGDSKQVICRKHVVLSAGAYGTPKLLQLSGIGNCDELSKLGIECVYNNTNVGENLKEILLSSMTHAVIDAPSAEDETSKRSLFHDNDIVNNIRDYINQNLMNKRSLEEIESTGTFGAILSHYYRSSTFRGNGTDMELSSASLYSGSTNLIFHQLGQLKLNSVGFTKIRDASAFSNPYVTTNLWSDPYDMLAYVELFKYVRTLMAASSAGTGKFYVEISPGFQRVPVDASDEQIISYLTSSITAGIHTTGTSSMHKVVDERLNLIGVPGISIADNGIIPTEMSSHSTSATAALIGQVKSRFMKEDL